MNPLLTHIALHVRNLDACAQFFQDYCNMHIVHERASDGKRILWLAEPGREKEFVFVLMPGGKERDQAPKDYSHLGFALPSRVAVDDIANRARADGRLFWEPVDEPFPVGYYCGVRDPNGTIIEFSHGQPLGPGGESPRTIGSG